ncbi:hypothetical protein [Rhodovulum sp. P5]|uniref:hypothetical protein n=1 Tax=Rhodovulum sp. P5 TaxID=1564506 RepID=UPI0009DAD2D5|nr:hypothetical protein [Rhodovulum sp. P5]
MHRLSCLIRPVLLLASMAFVAGCAARNQELSPPQDLGNFRLGHNIVVSKNMEKVPPSRDASAEEWKTVLTEAIDKQFRRYQGDKLYHLGVNIDGYSLAVPGIPVIASPKSILVISANVWDDAAGKKLNTEVKQITIWESLSGEMLLGSGLTMSKDQQMRDLAANAARQIEAWLVENREEWLGYDPASATGPAAETATSRPAPRPASLN